LRFDAERAREALAARAGDGQPLHGEASRRRRARPRRKIVSGVTLIQGRSSR
jgi:hypothetical protein